MKVAILSIAVATLSTVVAKENPISQANAEGYIICHPERILYPAKTEDVVNAVKKAAEDGLKYVNQNTRGLEVMYLFLIRVRPFAAGHSTNHVLCTDGISLSTTQNLTGIINVDPIGKTVRVYGGTRLATFTKELQVKHGLTILGLVDYGAITVAGAIATGAHSSSLKYPAAVHDHTLSFTIVDGTGTVRTITRKDGDAFFAARTNLGLLGVVVDVTFQAVDAFKVEAKQVDLSASVDHLEDVLIEQARSYDFANTYWFVTSRLSFLSRYF
jgi:FAD/FMN-containing dehydrogenase